MESNEANVSMSTDCSSFVCAEPLKTDPDDPPFISSNAPISVTTNSNTAPSVTATDNASDDVKDEFEEFCRFAFPEVENPDSEASDSTSEPFYFESDHVALKSNEDYRRLLRTFVLLESQRKSSLRDLDTLLQLQHEALSDPVGFSGQLARGDFQRRFPRRTCVAELPKIEWQRYTDDVESVLASLGGAAQSTRQKLKQELMSGIRNPATPRTPPVATASVDDTKPATFNQQWSADEQRHLEKLLEKYPPERFEARRFSKIAGELPGRTTAQVTSRVQKYFIKLAKAGLPVPGRMPNLAAHGGRFFTGRYHGRQRHGQFYYPPSTFLTSYAPPVYMSDDDDDSSTDFHQVMGSDTFCVSGSRSNGPETLMDDEEEEDVPEYLRGTEEYRELKLLSAIRRSRAVPSDSSSFLTHNNSSSDLTEDGSCVLRTLGSHIDPDYTSEATGVSSYLDPNYMPAV